MTTFLALSVAACGAETDRAPGDPGTTTDPSVIGGALDAGAARPDAAEDASRDGGEQPVLDAEPADDAQAQESAESQRERLLVLDAREPTLYAYDVSDRQLLATVPLAAAARLSAGSTGRFAYVTEGDERVRVIDTGLTSVETSAGPRLVPGAVQALPRAIPLSGAGALSAHDGKLALFARGDGSAHVLEEATLPSTTAPLVIDAGEAHEGLAVAFQGKLLISTLGAGGESQLQRFSASGAPEDTLDCLAPRALAVSSVGLAIGCSGGVLRWSAQESAPMRVPLDDAAAEITRLVAHPSQGLFLARIADQLCAIDSVLRCVQAPGELLDFAFDPSGKRALVLTRDGLLHVLDGRSLEEQRSFRALAALAPGATELPSMAVGKRWLYVSEPALGVVHVLHVGTSSVVDELSMPGPPGALLVLRYQLSS